MCVCFFHQQHVQQLLETLVNNFLFDMVKFTQQNCQRILQVELFFLLLFPKTSLFQLNRVFVKQFEENLEKIVKQKKKKKKRKELEKTQIFPLKQKKVEKKQSLCLKSVLFFDPFGNDV